MHLATFEDEFLLLFIDHMPFESNFGMTTLAECRRKTDEVFYVRQVDDFKQVAEISAAQGIRVLNAGYSYETEILERYSTLKPELAPKPLSVVSFAQKLKEISLTERNDFHELLMKADRILSRYHVRTNIRHFQPASLPVIFIASQEMLFRRSVEDVKRTSTPAWSGILENIMGDEHREKPELCFNASNHLIESLAKHAKVHPLEHLKEVVEVLYVQSLLFGRRSLTPQEVTALNEGVLKLTETHLKHL
jgi:molecular chaperone HtpG